MTTFFTFAGIIALFLFIKLIYDLYFKEKKNVFDFDLNSKSLELNKRETIFRLAKNLGCSTEKVKEKFINRLKEQQLTAAQIKATIQICEKMKYEESNEFGIKPEDTAAAYMKDWTIEFFKNKGYADRKRTELEIAEDWIIENSELKQIINQGEKSQLDNFLCENNELMDSMLEDLVFADKPADKYQNKAIHKIVNDEDYTGALRLINKGLELNDPNANPFLYELRAECNKNLLNNNDALNDMNKAIELMLKNLPERYYPISDFLKKRSKIKQELGDLTGAKQDEKISAEYFQKYKINKTDKIEDDELPF